MYKVVVPGQNMCLEVQAAHSIIDLCAAPSRTLVQPWHQPARPSAAETGRPLTLKNKGITLAGKHSSLNNILPVII